MVSGVPLFDKKDVKQVIEKIESKNGNRIADFSIKEIVLMLHKDQTKEISKINKKIDEHIKWGIKEDNNLNKVLADHDKIMQHITEILPEKGFCEKVNNTLFPKDDISLSKKVEIIWHDRRWLKYAAVGITGAIFIGIGNIILQVIING